MKELESWAILNASIMELDEERLTELLEEEKRTKARFSFLIRLQGRLNRLQNSNKMKALMK